MKKDNILLQIENLEDIEYFKKLGISNFLFPLKDFSIGYNTFSFDEISDIDNAFILANRLLTDDDIDEFLKLEIPSNIKGFIIEDVGLYEVLKGKGYTLINFQNHLNNNYATINYWLRYYDSLVLSTDLTKDEMIKIIKNADKPLVLNTFGYPMIMYSRRNLVSNYYAHLNEDIKYEIEIKEKVSNSQFILKESKYGTAVFNHLPYDFRVLIKDDIDMNICYYLLYTSLSDNETIKKVINGENVESVSSFLDKKTVYKVGDLK